MTTHEDLQDGAALLERMIAAAIEAGAAILAYYASDFEIRSKADESPVTAADHASEAVILARLRQAAPGIPIVAEEEVAAGRVPAVGRAFFLVDPLDGTKEFVQRRGDFTVNIALIQDAAPALGVVYAPARGWLYAGNVRTGEAFRMRIDEGSRTPGPRERIRVRSVPDSGITAVASRSHRTPETDDFLAKYRVAELVSIGSSLKFCLVAAGEADLYPRFGTTMEWDTAAGHAVLLAAGGSAVTPEGAPLRYGKPEFRNSHFIASGSVPTPHAGEPRHPPERLQ